jgi:hypothetical protein
VTDGLLKAAKHAKGIAEAGVSFRHFRAERQRPLVMGQGFLRLSMLLQHESDGVMRPRIARVESECLAEACDGQCRLAARAKHGRNCEK